MRAILIWLGLASAAAAQTQLAALDHGSVYEMSWDGRSWSAVVYITPAKGITSLSLAISGVTAGTRSNPAWLSAFTAQPYPSSGSIRAINLSTLTGRDLAKGTYDVGVELRSGEMREVKTIQMTIPGAAIAAQPLVVSRSIAWLVFPADSETLPPLPVRETGKRSFARIVIQQSDKAIDSEGTHSGTLVFDPAKQSQNVTADKKAFLVPSGQPADLPYSVEGEFPVGSAKLNLGIYSDQLDSVVTVPVEVRTHVTRWALGFMVVFGLVLGFLTRGIIKQRLEFSQARRQALDEASKLKSARDGVPDKAFRKKVDVAEKKVLEAIENARIGSEADLKTAVEAAETELKEAVTGLNSAAADEEKALKELRDFLETGWTLPLEFRAALDTLSSEARRAGELLENSNPTAAQSLRKLAENRLRGLLIEAMPAWQSDMQLWRDIFQAISRLAEDGVVVQTKLQEFRDAIGKAAAPATSAVLPDLSKSLDAIHDVTQKALALARYLRNAMVSTFDQMHAPFQDPLFGDLPIWKMAGSDTRQLSEALPDQIADLETPDKELAASADALRAEWRRCLVAENAPQSALDLYDKGEYIEPARAAAQARRERRKHAAKAAGGMVREFMKEGGVDLFEEAGAGGREEAGRISPRFPTTGAGPARRQAVETAAPKLDVPAAIRLLKARTLRELYATQLSMGIISTIGLAVVGYFVFADNWSGTSADMLKAFFWGFTTDIGLDALINAGKSKFGTAG